MRRAATLLHAAVTRAGEAVAKKPQPDHRIGTNHVDGL